MFGLTSEIFSEHALFSYLLKQFGVPEVKSARRLWILDNCQYAQGESD